MRIAIDLLPMQSPSSRNRGVGRYVSGLVAALSRRMPARSLVFLEHASFPPAALDPELRRRHELHDIPAPDRVDVHGKHSCLAHLLTADPLKIDAYFHPNPFEQVPNHDLPARPINGPLMVALVHDLIPLADQERYFANPDDGGWFRSRLHTIARYDLILTNSEATRLDCLARMALSNDRVVVVGAGVDRVLFNPMLQGTDAAHLADLGIDRPFFLLLGGADERKNVVGQLEAWKRSRSARSGEIFLVVTGQPPSDDATLTTSDIRPVGRVDDPTLAALYRQCIALLHVSHREGFGLPIAEAMSCGALVLAGDDPAQREVVGHAGIVLCANDPHAIATAIDQVVDAPQHAAARRRTALDRSSTFDWESVAARVESDIRDHMRPSLPRSPAAPRGRLAIFTPLPPKPSGIADHALRLARELRAFERIDLFHDADYVPDLRDRGGRLAAHDHRTFGRRQNALGYNATIYHMGNSWFHRYIYEALIERPGITVLHDPSLAGFHAWYGSTRPPGADHFRRELQHDDPHAFASFESEIESWAAEEDGLQGAAARRGVQMNRRVLDRSRHIIVHSARCRDDLSRRHPESANRISVVPLGADPSVIDPASRRRARDRLGINRDTLLLGCLGILTRNKMFDEAIEAFARVANALPKALLVFVGQDWENGAAQRSASRFGLGARVRFVGRANPDDYLDWIKALDTVISLRRPPTYGESSASLLDALRHGIPTIANDAGPALDFPAHVLHRLEWQSDGVDQLARAIRSLALDPARRQSLGRSAHDFVRDHHAWPLVAAAYEQIIERCDDEARRSRSQVA